MLCLDCGVVLCGNSEGKNHAKAHSISTGHGLGELTFLFLAASFIHFQVLTVVLLFYEFISRRKFFGGNPFHF